MAKLVVLLFAFCAFAQAQSPTKQTISNVTFLKEQLAKINVRGLKCSFEKKEGRKKSVGTVTVVFGKSDVDESGMIIESDDFAYGTDEVNEVLYDQENPRRLVINYGEEGNYNLLVSDPADPEYAAAVITSEMELANVGKCEHLK